MKPNGTALHFFLGSNTPQGFVSRFDQLADADDGWRCYVIKGGPGSGKSTMMKKVAQRLLDKGKDIEMIHCSSDVNSLDGVICPSLKFSIADGTSPHVNVISIIITICLLFILERFDPLTLLIPAILSQFALIGKYCRMIIFRLFFNLKKAKKSLF